MASKECIEKLAAAYKAHKEGAPPATAAGKAGAGKAGAGAGAAKGKGEGSAGKKRKA